MEGFRDRDFIPKNLEGRVLARLDSWIRVTSGPPLLSILILKCFQFRAVPNALFTLEGPSLTVSSLSNHLG